MIKSNKNNKDEETTNRIRRKEIAIVCRGKRNAKQMAIKNIILREGYATNYLINK